MNKKIKKKEIWVAPKHCPKMKECTEDVTWDSFETICHSVSWVYCKNATKEARKYKRKPYEWKLVHELGGLPDE